MKLHIGCGQRYLDGYVNIDYPPENHSVQMTSVADEYHDIRTLCYSSGSISEVRSHHVFEHFRRPVACGLLGAWNRWLESGGMVRIEVPDLKKTALIFLNPFASEKARAVAERHLFGSHEAEWAAHYEGYTADLLSGMVRLFGFSVDDVRYNSWGHTHNLEIFAKKSENIEYSEMTERARRYLSNFMVDESDVENRLLGVWVNEFQKQLDAGWS